MNLEVLAHGGLGHGLGVGVGTDGSGQSSRTRWTGRILNDAVAARYNQVTLPRSADGVYCVTEKRDVDVLPA